MCKPSVRAFSQEPALILMKFRYIMCMSVESGELSVFPSSVPRSSQQKVIARLLVNSHRTALQPFLLLLHQMAIAEKRWLPHLKDSWLIYGLAKSDTFSLMHSLLDVSRQLKVLSNKLISCFVKRAVYDKIIKKDELAQKRRFESE